MATAGPSTRKPNRIRLVSWAVCMADPVSRLPVLDTDGLYAASIVQARRGTQVASDDVEVQLQAPSSFLHARVPCLEDSNTGVVLADDIRAIEAYSRKLTGHKAPRSLLDETASAAPASGEDADRWARSKALEQHILANLHPIVHQSLFAKDLFTAHTVRTYQSGLGFVAKRSLPSRLRRNLQSFYADRGRHIDPTSGLAPILREANSEREIAEEDRKEREDLAQRAGIGIKGIRQPTGLLREEKQQAGRAFGQLRIVSYAEKALDVVAGQLGSKSFLSGHEKPSLLDLRLFSLLAPLLLPADQFPVLAASPVASLLRSSYPTLVEHTDRIRMLVWPIQTRTSANGTSILTTSNWPLLPGARADHVSEDPLSIRVANSLGRLTSEAYMFTTRLASRIGHSRNSGSQASSSSTSTPRAQPTRPRSAAEQREARMIAWGRYVWVASAFVGLIGTVFASGLLAIELVDEQDTDAEGEGPLTDEISDDSDEGDRNVQLIIEEDDDEQDGGYFEEEEGIEVDEHEEFDIPDDDDDED